MSLRLHKVCAACWDRLHPDRPSKGEGFDDPSPCCYCAASTTSGTYARADGLKLECKGACDYEALWIPR